MTEIRCKNCDKLLGKVNVNSKHNNFDIELKCSRCKHQENYSVKIKIVEDHESQE